MKIDDSLLSYAERAALQLRGLYASQGFRRFSMSLLVFADFGSPTQCKALFQAFCYADVFYATAINS